MIIDREKLLDAADSLTVAEHLGLEVRRVGNRNSILCPAHNDTHYGSCILTEKGFICYSCGAHGSVIDLVMLAEDKPYGAAVEILGECCGGKEFYQASSDYYEMRLLDGESRHFLGIKNRPVYTELPADEECDEENCQYEYSVVTGELICLEKRLLAQNPLLELMKNDEEAYHELIAGKALEKYDFYTSILRELHHPSLTALGRVCAEIRERIPFNECVAFLMKRANKAEDLLIEHGGTLPNREIFQQSIDTKEESSLF